jgi:RNA polymerase sigma factor (sigma-70 family)
MTLSVPITSFYASDVAAFALTRRVESCLVVSMEVRPDFREIVDAHYAGLYRFALSMCRKQATAEDLVQQTFLQWARKGSGLRDVSKVKSWLFTTIYREWLAIARKEKRFETVEFNPEIHGEADVSDLTDPGPIDNATLRAALDELDESFRAPLVLFYMKELPYKEIAEVLEVPIGTVMSRLSRGKTMLRNKLKGLAQGEGAGSSERGAAS